VRQFCQVAFDHLNLNYEDYVSSSPEFLRPIDSVNLEGNAQKLKAIGWSTSISFEELVHKMVDSDLALLQAKSVNP
jgi:GDPmannose 4,6-dehydratase